MLQVGSVFPLNVFPLRALLDESLFPGRDFSYYRFFALTFGLIAAAYTTSVLFGDIALVRVMCDDKRLFPRRIWEFRGLFVGRGPQHIPSKYPFPSCRI